MKVKLHNLSVNHHQQSWVSMGVPNSVAEDYMGKHGFVTTMDDGGDPSREFPAVFIGNELFVKASLAPFETVTGHFRSEESDLAPFKWADWVIDAPEKLLPSFEMGGYSSEPMSYEAVANPDEGDSASGCYYTIVNANPARTRFYFRTTLSQLNIWIEGWLDFFSDQDVVNYSVRATYGTVADPGHRFFENAPSLQMILGEPFVVDQQIRKGLRGPTLVGDKWVHEIVNPRTWERARVFESFGAIGSTPEHGLTPSEENFIRLTNLMARQEGPIVGMVTEVWDGEYLAFGKVPEKHLNSQSDLNQAFSDFNRDLNRPGDEMDPRRYAQPPNSGQTGEQPDFGASRCNLVVTMEEPWALWQYRFCTQAWMLRPYANKEPDGSPMKSGLHDTTLYQLRPDERISRNDMLGWPVPVGWVGGYTTSDDQHRSDNMLLGMYALTRDPSIKRTIEDLIELQTLEMPWGNGYMPTPRGVGRVLQSLAHMYTLGFDKVLPIINKYVDAVWEQASFRSLPEGEDRTVKVLKDNGGKYGWLDSNGNAIRAWVCWEEAIASMGLWAVWKATGNVKAKTISLILANTVTNHGFFKTQDGHWRACYAVRWDPNNPGVPLPQSSYLTATNGDVYAYSMQRWMLPSLKILEGFTEDEALKSRCDEIITYFGPPRNADDASWWAV
jgi:hypothetical protein